MAQPHRNPHVGERQDSGDDPDGEHAREAGHVPVDFGGLNENRRADDDADHHGRRMEQADGTFESRTKMRGRQDGPVYHRDSGRRLAGRIDPSKRTPGSDIAH